MRAQGLPGCLPWGMLLVFFNDFLAQQKGFSVPAATLVRKCSTLRCHWQGWRTRAVQKRACLFGKLAHGNAKPWRSSFK